MTDGQTNDVSSSDASSSTHLNILLDQFDAEWKKFVTSVQVGNPPQIEVHLAQLVADERSDAFAEFLRIDLDYRQQHDVPGQTVEYLTRFPDYQSTVMSVFAELVPASRDDSKSATHSTTILRPNTESDSQLLGETHIGKYEIVHTLGRGGQAVTFLVHDPDLNRQVVIKRYHTSGTLTERQAVLNEGRALARVRSRYVAQCLGVERDANELFLVMEYIRGKNLCELNGDRIPDFRASAKLISQVAEGLDDVHLCGIVHRDIKPANIIVCKDGTPRLVDFGLAIPLASETLDEFAGTLQYMAPEQARADLDNIDQRTDVFGLGAVLYFLLAGRPPYGGESKHEVWEQAKHCAVTAPSQWNPQTPQPLERICLRAMSPSPAKRYRSSDAFARALRRYLRENDAGRPSTSLSLDLAPNPYRGLASFSEKDAAFFYGRDAQIERLWNAFRGLHTEEGMESGTPRLLPILGPSGSGKSSLARAGLWAELLRRPLPERERTRYVLLTPGTHPLESLSTAVARLVTDDATPVAKSREFEEQLRVQNDQGDFDGLRRIADAIPDITESPIVLIIDQFEEVYSLCEAEADRQAFLATLIHAAAAPSGRVSVILTIRSDFLGETQDNAALNSLISQHGLIVPAMNDDELRHAIAEPARNAGQPFEPAFVALLVEETRDREGALPLLQFTLSRVWEAMREGQRPDETLAQLGGVGGALAGEAQRLYDDLDGDARAIAKRAFLALIQLGEGTRDTRRRARVESIIGQRHSLQDVRAVLFKFASAGARLITLSTNTDGSEEVEVTHEALFDHWQTLAEWLDEERDDIRLHRRIEEATNHWEQKGRPVGLLWRSPDLDVLRAHNQRRNEELTPLQNQFFMASDREQMLEERKRRKRLLFYRGALLLFGLLICVIAYFAYRAGVNEELAQSNAEAARRSEETATLAKETARRRSYASQLLMARHHSLTDGRVSRIWELLNAQRPTEGETDLRHWEWYHLVTLLNQEALTLHGHIGPAHSVDWSADGARILSGGEDGTVRIWTSDQSDPAKTLYAHDSPILAVAWAPDSQSFASASKGGDIKIWNATNWELQVAFHGSNNAVNTIDWHSSGRKLAAGGADGIVRIWDVSTGREFVALKPLPTEIRSLKWSPDGQTLAAGHGDAEGNTVELSMWETSSWRRTISVNDAPEEAWSVSWSPNGKQLAMGADLQNVKLFDVASRTMVVDLPGHINEVKTVAWQPNAPGAYLASGGNDATIKIWDMAKEKLIATLCGHDGPVTAIEWSPDGNRLVSSSKDGTLKIWEWRADKSDFASLKTTFPNWVSAVSWHPQGQFFATAYLQNDLAICDARTGEVTTTLQGHTKRVWNVAWSRQGDRLATASMDRTARIWSESGEMLLEFRGHQADVRNVSWNADGTLVASIAADAEIVVWDSTTGEARRHFHSHGHSTHCDLAWSPRGNRLALPAESETIDIWDLESDQHLFSLWLHSAVVNTLAWAPVGDLLAAACNDGRIAVWDLKTREIRFVIRTQSEGLRSLTWSPDAKRLVTGSADGAVRMYTDEGLEVVTLLKGQGRVWTVSWSPDGERIAAGTWDDNAVRIWDAHDGFQIADTPKFIRRWRRSQAEQQVAKRDYGNCELVVKQLSTSASTDVQSLFDAACVLCTVVEAVANDNSLDAATRAEMMERYKLNAVQMLRQLLEQHTASISDIRLSTELATIADDPRFVALMDQYDVNPSRQIVKEGANWKYLDDGSRPADGWQLTEFDDSAWREGKAQLGYGEGDEATVMEYGPDSKNKFVTYYFRHTFEFDESSAGGIRDFGLRLLRDDGAIVYLNGVEVYRDEIDPQSQTALNKVDDAAESEHVEIYTIPAELISLGTNVIAVEVHQQRADSSDVSFDLSLSGNIVDSLVHNLSAPSPSIRYQTAEVFSRQSGIDSRPAISAFMDALTSEDPIFRAKSAKALGACVDETGDVVRALAATLADPDSTVRRAGRDSLSRILSTQPQLLADVIAEMDNHPQPIVQVEFCQILGEFAEATTETTAALKRMLAGDNRSVRVWALAVLMEHDPTLARNEIDANSLIDELSSLEREQIGRWLASHSWRRLIKAAPTEQDFVVAKQQIELTEKLLPDHELVLNAAGIVHYRLGEYEQAVEDLLRSDNVDSEPRFVPQALNSLFLAMSYFQLNQLKELRGQLTRFARLRVDIRYAGQIAELLLQSRREFVEHVAAKIDPANATDTSKLDLVQRLLQLPDSRVGTTTNNRGAGNAEVERISQIARSHLANHNYEEAIAAYSSALQRDPSAIEAIHMRAHAYTYVGKWSEAISDFNQAIMVRPTDAHLFLARAQCHLATSDGDAALKDATDAKELEPDRYSTNYLLGAAYYATGNFSEALAVLEIAGRAEQTSPSALFYLAMTYQELGKTENALASYQRAIRLTEKDALADSATETLRVRREAEKILGITPEP